MTNCKFENGNVIIPLSEIGKLADHYLRMSQRTRHKDAREYWAGKADILQDILLTYQEDCRAKHQEQI